MNSGQLKLFEQYEYDQALRLEQTVTPFYGKQQLCTNNDGYDGAIMPNLTKIILFIDNFF
jgi:hypothetical protein